MLLKVKSYLISFSSSLTITTGVFFHTSDLFLHVRWDIWSIQLPYAFLYISNNIIIKYIIITAEVLLYDTLFFSSLNPHDKWFLLTLADRFGISASSFTFEFGFLALTHSGHYISSPLFPKPGLTWFTTSSRSWPGCQLCPFSFSFLRRNYFHQQLEMHGDRTCRGREVKGHINSIHEVSTTWQCISFICFLSFEHIISHCILYLWSITNRNISETQLLNFRKEWRVNVLIRLCAHLTFRWMKG